MLRFVPNLRAKLEACRRLRAAYAELPVVVRRLMTARAARSLGQGALVAAFTLYLHALGWPAPAIGATLSAALLAGAALTLAVGPLSDRRGRRRFLLLYEAFQAGAALLAMITAWPPALVGILQLCWGAESVQLPGSRSEHGSAGGGAGVFHWEHS